MRRHRQLPAEDERVGREVIDAAIAVHRRFGPGLLEAVYEEALAIELRHRGIVVSRQVALALEHRSERLATALRIDLLVANLVIVEVKSVRELTDVHTAQILTYLRLSGRHLGFLINFNSTLLKHGIRRVID